MENQKVDLFVRARAVVTPDRDGNVDIYQPGYLAVDDGKIVDVGQLTDEVPYRGKELLSLPGHVIFPGFVNAHTHTPMTLFRGLADDLPLKEWLEEHIWPMEGKYVSPEFVYIGARLAILEMLKSGVTCFADMYFAMEEVARAAKEAGVRACVGEGILDFPTPTSPDTSHAFKRTERLIDSFRNDELIYPFVAPHSPYTCSEDTLRFAYEMALDKNVSLHIHLAEEKWEMEKFLAEKGKTSIAYLDEIGFFNGPHVTAAHVNWTEDSDLEILSDRRVGVAHNPKSNMKLATGICRVSDMLEKNVIIGLGTDGAASNNTLSVLEEAQEAARLHKIAHRDPTVLPAKTAFLMATISGAQAVGLSDRLGSLEPGKWADFVAINFDKPHLTPVYDFISHLIYAVKSSDIEFVYVAGRPVLMKGRAVNIDEEEVMEAAVNFARKMVG